MDRKTYIIGVICGIMTGVCWAVSGVFGQFLFQTRGVETYWLVPIRLTTAGVVLLTYLSFRERNELVRLMTDRRSMVRTAVAGIFGTMMFQLTFFGAVQRSNAGTATVLQYLAPIIILIFVCFAERKLPKKAETAAVIAAFLGVLLISTDGKFGSLVMTPAALGWGVACAFFMSLNTVLPAPLYKKYPTPVVTAWALLFGGICLSAILRPWQYSVTFDLAVVISLIFIIGGGSVAAYLFYSHSIKTIGPDKASICACSEPVVATLLSMVWLGTEFDRWVLFGFILIIGAVVVLNLSPRKTQGDQMK